MEKKTEGYVELKRVEQYQAKKCHYFTVHRESEPAFDYHVTLSPVEDQEPVKEPDHNVMINTLIYLREHCGDRFRPNIQWVIDFLILQTKHTPQGNQPQEPDHKAMWEDLEQDFNGTYSWQLSTRSESLKSILKKIQAKHTPQAGVKKKER